MPNLVASASNVERERSRLLARRFVVAAKRNKWPDLQLQRFTGQQAILHAHGVLVMDHRDGFLESHSLMLECPHSHAMIESEFRQQRMRFAFKTIVLEFGSAQVQTLSVNVDPFVTA